MVSVAHAVDIIVPILNVRHVMYCVSVGRDPTKYTSKYDVAAHVLQELVKEHKT